jgi:competence protein ComEA
MVGLGMKTTDDELRAILAFLTEHYPAEELPPVNVNKARAIELESRLSLKRSEAAAILRYRKANGDFRSIDDLLKVPGIDTAKIEAKKDQLAF